MKKIWTWRRTAVITGWLSCALIGSSAQAQGAFLVTPYYGFPRVQYQWSAYYLRPNTAVTLYFNNPHYSLLPVGQCTTDSNGHAVLCSFVIPDNYPVTATGPYQLIAATPGFDQVLYHDFLLESPRVQISPTSGGAGSVATLSGDSYLDLEQIRIYFNGVLQSSVNADNRGQFSTPLTIPSAPPGTYPITAVGQQYGAPGSTSFTVVVTVPPTLSLNGTDFCYGDSWTITVTNGAPNSPVRLIEEKFSSGWQVVWDSIAGNTNGQGAFTVTYQSTNPGAGTYRDHVAIAGLDSNYVSYEYHEGACPIPVLALNNSVYCQGDTWIVTVSNGASNAPIRLIEEKYVSGSWQVVWDVNPGSTNSQGGWTGVYTADNPGPGTYQDHVVISGQTSNYVSYAYCP